MIHGLLYIFIMLCIVGLILWGINQIPGIPQIVKVVLYVVIGVLMLLWCLNYVGGNGAGLGLR